MNIQPTSYLTAAAQTAKINSAGANAKTGSNQNAAADSASTTLLQTSYYDKRDVNEDGYVSPLEELLYELAHPGTLASAVASYTAEGKLAAKASARLINTIA